MRLSRSFDAPGDFLTLVSVLYKRSTAAAQPTDRSSARDDLIPATYEIGDSLALWTDQPLHGTELPRVPGRRPEP